MKTQIRNVSIVPEGDGVEVKRLFPVMSFMNVDPFVLWDHFDIGAGHGFPDHPHRGFEAITYMFDGGMNHKDNLGNASYVSAGGAQRFTAGSGLVHSEMPAQSGKSNGIQLWINLPKKLKTMNPSYQQVNADEFPIIELNGGWVKIIVGEGSPLTLNTDVIYQHVNLQDNENYKLEVGSNMRGLVYVMQGSLSMNNQLVKKDQACFIEHTQSLEFISNGRTEFMICFGRPSGEEIYQHGPFVD